MVGGALAGWIYDFMFAVNATPAKFRGFFTRDYDNDRYTPEGPKRNGEAMALKDQA